MEIYQSHETILTGYAAQPSPVDHINSMSVCYGAVWLNMSEKRSSDISRNGIAWNLKLCESMILIHLLSWLLLGIRETAGSCWETPLPGELKESTWHSSDCFLYVPVHGRPLSLNFLPPMLCLSILESLICDHSHTTSIIKK